MRQRTNKSLKPLLDKDSERCNELAKIKLNSSSRHNNNHNNSRWYLRSINA